MKRSLLWFLAGALLVGMGKGIPEAKKGPGLKKATFAAGCFWGVEKILSKVDGVVSTSVGYAGGTTENPTYEEVCTGRTGHAEAVELTYDPSRVPYEELLITFFEYHDPTTLNRQGPDVGSQYRSVIFTHDEEQARLAGQAKEILEDSKVFPRPLVTEIVPAGKFHRAEEYHQKYLQKNPGGTCSHPLESSKIREALRAKLIAGKITRSEEEWRGVLSPEQFRVLRQKGTESPFTGQYFNLHEYGIYRCAACGNELFSSEAKFDSGTGWPSYFEPVSPDSVSLKPDGSHFMRRTEVLCGRCGSHLGHLFDDGPRPTGKRYCINSVSLDFLKKREK